MQFLNRNGAPKEQTAVAASASSANKAPTEENGTVDGWGSAKQLQEESEAAEIKEEDFVDIPF